MTTPKQDRNGVPGPGATGGNVAQPGPDAIGEIRSAQKQAQNAGTSRAFEGRGLFVSPAGSGVDGHEVGGYGAMFEWDAGLAINEPAGEA